MSGRGLVPNDGSIQQVNDPTGTYTFAYDNMGRLLGTTTQYSFLPGHQYTNSYGYDAASNRTSFTAPDSSTASYVYDTINRLQTLTSSFAGQFGFGYDALGRRTSLTRPNGVSTSYNYDSMSRLLSVLHQAGGVTIDGASYTVDDAGNRTSKQNLLSGVTDNYTYDLIYQLTQTVQGATTTESYSYDAVGNRLSSLGLSPYQYNSSNQLNSTPNVAFSYDNNGNTLTKADSSGVTGYSWDYENRLTSVTLPGTGGTVSFKYDPFGRRIQKSGPAGITNYLYDGENLIEELDNAGNVGTRYMQTENTDEPLAELRSNTTSYYQADALGSITSLTNTSATTVATYVYDAFGNLSASTGPLASPFRYTAREFDSETGLYYYRARYSQADNGRFVAEDDIRYSPNRNRYTYVSNNPVAYRDPSGHSEECTLEGITTFRLLNTVINSNFGPWSLSPWTRFNKYPGTWLLFCTWTRTYERTVLGNALKMLAFRCIERYPCGMAPRGRIKYKFEHEHWFISRTTETEREGTGPFSSFAVLPQTQASECQLYGPPPE